MLNTRSVATAGIIAALYVVLTWIASLMGLASGAIQIRLSEVLTILPCLTVSAIPGLAIGCLIANLVTGCPALDVVFGTVATVIGAFGTYFLRKKPALAWIPPVLSNAVIVPFVLIYAYGLEDAWWYLFLTVGLGEVVACGVLGSMLYRYVKDIPHLFG